MFSSSTFKDSLKLAHGLEGLTNLKIQWGRVGGIGLQAGNLGRPAEPKGRVLAELSPVPGEVCLCSRLAFD